MSLNVKVSDHVARITLSNPDAGNRISQKTVGDIANALNQVAKNVDVKVVVIDAMGENFCVGREQGGPKSDTPLALRAAMMEPIIDVYRAFRNVEVPIICLVQGQANGFGAALAASADMTIAASNAKFSFPELKSNMPPTLAMATVMDRVPLKALTWMVFTSRPIEATRAQQSGLVSEVVPTEQLASFGEEVVAGLLEKSRSALCGAKQYLATSRMRNFEDAADYGANLLASVLLSQK